MKIEIISLIYRSRMYLDFISKQLLDDRNIVAGADVSVRIVANDPTPTILLALPQSGVKYEVYHDPKPDDYYLNRVYRCWNHAVVTSTADIVCLVNSDMAFSKDWLQNLMKHHDGRNIVSSRLVESGRMPSDTHGIGHNLGMHPNEFRESEWHNYAKSISEDKLLPGGLYMPVLFDKETFINSGGYPEGNIYTTGIGEYKTGRHIRSGDDYFFNATLRSKYGMRHVTAFDSLVYHFQSGEMLLSGDDA